MQTHLYYNVILIILHVRRSISGKADNNELRGRSLCIASTGRICVRRNFHLKHRRVKKSRTKQKKETKSTLYCYGSGTHQRLFFISFLIFLPVQRSLHDNPLRVEGVGSTYYILPPGGSVLFYKVSRTEENERLHP